MARDPPTDPPNPAPRPKTAPPGPRARPAAEGSREFLRPAGAASQDVRAAKRALCSRGCAPRQEVRTAERSSGCLARAIQPPTQPPQPSVRARNFFGDPATPRPGERGGRGPGPMSHNVFGQHPPDHPLWRDINFVRPAPPRPAPPPRCAPPTGAAPSTPRPWRRRRRRGLRKSVFASDASPSESVFAVRIRTDGSDCAAAVGARGSRSRNVSDDPRSPTLGGSAPARPSRSPKAEVEEQAESRARTLPEPRADGSLGQPPEG